MNLKPIGNLVLIQLEPKEFKTSDTGIVLSVHKSIVEDRETSGKVIDIGEQVKDIKIGDTVYFEVISGIDLDGNRLIIREDSILGYIR